MVDELGAAGQRGVSASFERARGQRDLGTDEVLHELERGGGRLEAIVEMSATPR